MKIHKLISFIPILALITFSFSKETKQDGDKQINSQSANKLLLKINPQQNTIESGLRLATFDVDATPPVGEHDPSHSWHYKTFSNSWDMGLRAKGIILLGAGKPIVICAIDWGCIGNDAHDAFKSALADAAGTTPERVAVHTLHQHDAPWADFSIERILKESGINPLFFEGSFHREFKRRLATAVGNSIH